MRKLVIIGLTISAALILLIAPFASSWPDGLERVAINLGFIEKGEGLPVLRSPMPDYMLNFIENERLSTILAGLIGVIVMFLIVYIIGLTLKRRQNMEKN
jgi:cobalt/nickel transport protein